MSERQHGLAYEREHVERQILHLLAHGETEIEAGEGSDLDTVLSDADALLEEDVR